MPSKSDVTDSNAASPKITDYQYYGAAGDGKRAEGFRSIEGISGIHAADEVYTFYFKAGKPYVSDKKGNSLFTLNAKKYAFSDLGIMQTGRQIANVANDEIANFYFGEDGIVRPENRRSTTRRPVRPRTGSSTLMVTRKGRATTVSATASSTSTEKDRTPPP